MVSSKILVEKIAVKPYRIPADFPESDGTLSWDSTTIIMVEINAGGKTGMGYTILLRRLQL